MKKNLTLIMLVLLLVPMLGLAQKGDIENQFRVFKKSTKSFESEMQFNNKYISGETVDLSATITWAEAGLDRIELIFPEGAEVVSAEDFGSSYSGMMTAGFNADIVYWDGSSFSTSNSPSELVFSVTFPADFTGDLTVKCTVTDNGYPTQNELSFDVILIELTEEPLLVVSTSNWYTPLMQVSSTVSSNSDVTIYNDGKQNLEITDIQNVSAPYTIENSLPIIVEAQKTEDLLINLYSEVKGCFNQTISLVSNGGNQDIELLGAVYDESFEKIDFEGIQYPPVGWTVDSYGTELAWEKSWGFITFRSYDEIDSSAMVTPFIDLSTNEDLFIGFNLSIDDNTVGTFSIDYLVDGDTDWKSLESDIKADMAANGDVYYSLANIEADKVKLRIKAVVESGKISIDNIVLPAYYNPNTVPEPAVKITPVEGDNAVLLAADFSWDKVLFADGYKIYIDTLPEPVKFYDVGDESKFKADLQKLTNYYWKVVPYNEHGDAVDCPVWSFITELHVPTVWTDNTELNTQITYIEGVKYLPRVVMTSKGETFMSWFGYEDDNLNLKLQLLDTAGREKFRRNGFTVSENAQGTSLSDYTLAIDKNDNAIIAFTDVRNGGIDAFIYKVSETGDMLMGDNGICLSENINEDVYSPILKQDSSENIYVKFALDSGGTEIVRLNKNGQYLLDNTYSIDDYIFEFAIAENGDSYITYLSGGFLYMDILDTLMVSKLSEPTVVSTLPEFEPYGPKIAYVELDKSGGAYIVWQGAFAFTGTVKWQYVDKDGNISLSEQGEYVSTNHARTQTYVRTVYLEDEDKLLTTWDEKLESLTGFYAQKMDKDGNISFGETGKIVVGINDTIGGTDDLILAGDTIMWFCSIYEAGSYRNNYLDVIFLDNDLNLLEKQGTVRYSSTPEHKPLQDVCLRDDMAVMVWTIDNEEGYNIFAQNIYTDGTMGYTEIDTVPPVLYEANVLSNKKVQLLFDEPLLRDSAEIITAYNIEGDATVVGAELLAPQELILTINGMVEGVQKLYMQNVTDLLLNTNPLDSVEFSFVPDNSYPKIVTVKAVADNKIVIRFNEPVMEEDVAAISNYTLDNATIESVKVITTQQVVLYTSDLTEQDYNLTILKYSDVMENVVENDEKTFSFAFNTGSLVYFEEDFSNGMPESFSLFDYDKGTPIPELAEITEAWVAIILDEGIVAGSASRYDPVVQADDWMITGKVDVKKTPYIFWNALAVSGILPDGYEIWASTSGTTPEDFTVKVFEISEEHYEWRSRFVDLSDFGFGDDTIYIAFRNISNNKYVLFVDDIEVYTPNNIDVATISSDIPTNVLAGASLSVNCEIVNKGLNTIESFNFNYRLAGGETFSNTVDTISLEFAQSVNLTHSMLLQLPQESGVYTLQIWASEPNGEIDENLTNDTLSIDIQVNGGYVQRLALLEHFTNTDCGPCATYNPVLEQLLTENGNEDKVLHITYHPNWPGDTDPFYLFNKEENMARTSLYNIFDIGVPTVQVAGNKNQVGPSSVTQKMINDEHLLPGLVKIEGSAKFKESVIDVEVELTNLLDFTNAKPTLFVVVTQDFDLDVAPGGNGETIFPNVMRKLLPGKDGDVLVNLDSASVNSFIYSYTMPEDMFTDDVEIGIFVQDSETNEIFMAGKLELLADTSIGINDIARSMIVYPNPAKNIVYVKAENEIKSVQIINILGAVVSTQASSGTNSISVNIQNLPSGVYFINTQTINGNINKKFLIEK